MVGRSRWGGRRDGGNRGNDDRQWKVLNWDVSEGDVLNYFLKMLMDVCVLQLGVWVLELRTDNVVLLGGDISKDLKEVERSGDKGGGGWSEGDNGWQVDDKGGLKKGRQADRRVGEHGDSEWGGAIAFWTQVVPGVVGTIEEVLDDLVSSGDVYLVNIVNLQPRGDRQGRGGNGSGGGGGGGDKRRQNLNTFN